MGLPAISGTATQGGTLTADTSGITDADGFFTPPNFLYQWKADGADISGGLAATFILTQSQVGKAITVTVSYTDRGRNDESLTSAETSAVVNVNDAPTITGIPRGTVAEDSAYSFTPSGADVDAGTTLVYSITNKPSWATFSATTGALTGTPGNDDVFFTMGIVISVTDGMETASLQPFNLVVTPVNDAPTITGMPATTVVQDQPYSFTPGGGDVDDGATLVYSIANKPSWAMFSTTTGALTGTPTNVGSTSDIVITLTSGSDTVSLPAFNLAVTIEADNTAPDAPVITQPTTPTNDDSITINGSAEAGATVTLTQNDTVLTSPTATAGANGDWSIEVTLSANNNGANTFTATASDAAGNVSTPSAAVSITLDTVAPTVTITNPTQLVRTDAFTLTGTTEAGATVDVFKDSTSIGAVNVTGTTWSVATTLIEGLNAFTATATDAAGNTSTANIVITLNSSLAAAPVITVINTVLNNANEQGVICITFDANVVFDRSADAAFLNERLGDFTLSSDASPALTVTDVTSCFVDGEAPRDAIQLTLNRQIAFGETATLSYTKTGTEHNTKGIRRDLTGGSEPLADFSDKPITNNAIAPIEGLELVSAGTFSANQIFLSFGIEIVTASPDLVVADFTVSGAASNPTVTGISQVAPSALLLTLDADIVGGETITLSYAKTVGSITGATEGGLEDFTDYSVTNNRPLAAPSISISPNTVTATVGTAIAPITIASTGGTVASYSIEPALPAGLTLDTTTGTISGTPTAVAEAVTYTITATNSAGTNDATVAITVNADPAPVITPPVQSAVPAITTASAATVSTAMFTVTGTAEPGVKITILQDDPECDNSNSPTGTGTVVSDAEGNWTIDITLCEGVNNIQAVASILGENPDKDPSALSEAIVITLDIPVPARERLPKPVITTSPTLPVSTAMFTVAGTAEPGVKITILQDDPECDNSNSPTGTGTVVSDAEGDWTIDITLCEGVNNIQAVASIPGENPDKDPSALPNMIVVTLDTTDPAPVITPPVQSAVPAITTASAATVSTAMFTVTGTAEPGVKIRILRDGSGCANTPRLSGSGVSDADGDWTIDITLCDGVNNIQAVATMAGKAPSALSEAIVITLDTTDPAPVITPPVQSAVPAITTASAATVSTAMFTVTGTAEPGVKITILRDGSGCANTPRLSGSGVSDAEGDWTIDITLCDGVNNIQAVATMAGKAPSALSEAIVITLDTTDPAPVITPPVQSAVPAITTASAATVSTAMFTVTGTAEPGVKITILRDGSGCANTPRLSGSGVSDAEGDWTIDITLCDGVNNIQAVATMAGKAPSALSEAIVITLDTTDPAPVITPPVQSAVPAITTASAATVSTAMFTVTGTAEPGVKITILRDGSGCANTPRLSGSGVSDAEGDWTIDITLCDGVNNIQAVATMAGKAPSALSEAIVITLDTTDPAPVITPPVQSAVPAITTASAATVSTAMFTVTGTAEPGVKITILRDGSGCANTPRLSGSGVSDAEGDWTIDITLCDGVNNIQAVATMAGKAPSALSEAIVITLDIPVPARERLPKPVITTSPTLPVSTAMFTVAGTAEPGVKITILQDDPECDNSNSPTGTGTVVSDAEGNWTIDITLCEGVNNIQAVASIPGENPDKDPSALPNMIVVTLDIPVPARERLPKPVITTSPTLPVSTAMFTVTGTAEPGVKITILRDGSGCANTPRLSGSGVSDAEGDWTIDITLCDGVNNIQAVATMAGKAPSALSEAIVITLDIPVPARERLPKPVITTSPTLPVSTAMFTVAGTAEPGVKITILQDDPECDNSNSPTGTGTVVSDAEGNWTIDITLCEGVNNIQAVASIPGENPDKDPSALPNMIVVTLDIPVPARERLPKPVITTASAATVSTAMFTVAGTAEPGVKITILQDDPECDNSNSPTGTGTVVSDAEGNWTIDITLCEGVNNIQAVASIPGENPDKDPSALPNMIVVTLDTTDPAPVITPPVPPTPPTAPTASAAPPILVDPLQLSAARLTVVLGETKEVTISGGLPPYVAPFVSGDLGAVRTSIDGTTLRITGLRVGKADTAQVRLRPRGSASGLAHLEVKVNAPPLLNPGDIDGSGSKSLFRGGASSDGGETYFKDNAFSVGESLNIVFVITPRRSDTGEQVDVVVAARETSAPDAVVLLTPSGLVPWDGETLFFFKQDLTLERNSFINLTPEPITLWPAEVGSYELFVGYLLADGELLYHPEPLKIQVAP